MRRYLKIFLLSFFALGVFTFGFFSIRNQDWFSNFNVDALLERYSPAEIEHFAYFAFNEGCILKWNSDIKIVILPQEGINNELYSILKSTINALNNLMEEVKIVVVKKDQSNTQFYFVDTIYFGKTGTTKIGADKFKFPYPSLSLGEIKIKYDNRNIKDIHSTILHEFTHLLGFHHQRIGYQSTFNANQRKLIGKPPNEKWVSSFDTFPDLDKAAIRIMYDADVAIDPGITKEKFFRKIQEARINQVR